MNTTLQVTMNAQKTSKTSSSTGSTSRNAKQAPKQFTGYNQAKIAKNNMATFNTMPMPEDHQRILNENQSSLAATNMGFNMSATSTFVPTCQ